MPPLWHNRAAGGVTNNHLALHQTLHHPVGPLGPIHRDPVVVPNNGGAPNLYDNDSRGTGHALVVADQCRRGITACTQAMHWWGQRAQATPTRRESQSQPIPHRARTRCPRLPAPPTRFPRSLLARTPHLPLLALAVSFLTCRQGPFVPTELFSDQWSRRAILTNPRC